MSWVWAVCKNFPHPQCSLSLSLKPGCSTAWLWQTICHFSKRTDQSHHTNQIVKESVCEKDPPTAAATQLLTYPVVQGWCRVRQSLKTFKCLEVNWTSEKLLNFEERKKMLRLKKKEESKLRDMRSEAERRKQVGKYCEDLMREFSPFLLTFGKHQHAILIINTQVLKTM